MSVSKVKEHLKKFNLDKNIITLDSLSATVNEASSALKIDPDMVAKTLAFLVCDDAILIVMSGDSKVDNHKYKTYFGKKAKMVPASDVEALTNHPVGGVCPFGVPENVKIYFDESLRHYKYVYPACGSINTAIKISIEDLEMVVGNYTWIDVCKKD